MASPALDRASELTQYLCVYAPSHHPPVEQVRRTTIVTACSVYPVSVTLET